MEYEVVKELEVRVCSFSIFVFLEVFVVLVRKGDTRRGVGCFKRELLYRSGLLRGSELVRRIVVVWCFIWS